MPQRIEIIINDLYEIVSEDIVDTISDPNVNDFTTILSLLCRISGLVETLRVSTKPMKGSEKKEIVLKLCRTLLEKHTSEDLVDQILDIYDRSAHEAIETIIMFAKNNKILTKTDQCFQKFSSCW